MASEWKYRGRVVTTEDIAFIRELIASNPGVSRRRLSALLCQAWQWKQANGTSRDMVCRGLLLMLDRAGQIQLPAVRYRPPNPLARREPPPMRIDTTPVIGSLNQIQPIELRQVRRTADEPLFNSLMEQYHYLDYEQPVGEHLKYLALAQGRPIACLAWSSAPRHLGSRDRYIGWGAEARRRNIRYIAYNTRFLILPWVRVPHLASHILGKMTGELSQDWERVTDTRCTSPRPSSTPAVFGGPVIGRRTGNCSVIQQAGAKPRTVIGRIARSRKYSVYRLHLCSASY